MDEATFDGARRILATEIAHWRAAAHSVGDLEGVAAPAAWGGATAMMRSLVAVNTGASTSSTVTAGWPQQNEPSRGRMLIV